MKIDSYRRLRSLRWFRRQVQFLGALLWALIVPFLVAGVVSPHVVATAAFWQSFYIDLIAIIAGHYVFKSIVSFPGIRSSYYILPVFVTSFALSFVVSFLLRLSYSRPLLIVDFVICIAWFYIVDYQLRRKPLFHIAMVPGGDVASLREIKGINWVLLDSPTTQVGHFHGIVADFRADMPDEWEHFLADAALAGSGIFHIKQLRESLTGRIEIEHLSENANGSLRPQAAYHAMKLLAEISVSFIALVVLAPFFLLIALAIRLNSPGPVFFRQTRIGYRGVRFKVWKFRTMYDRPLLIGDAARADAMTLHGDVRITKVGRFLRRTRIDELPQLLNVVIGEMGLIGPRPEAEVLSHWYEAEIPFYRYRHILRPGITGWAQVNQGHVTDVQDIKSKLHYDFYYIANFSLWLDMLIVVRTLATMFRGSGSK